MNVITDNVNCYPKLQVQFNLLKMGGEGQSENRLTLRNCASFAECMITT